VYDLRLLCTCIQARSLRISARKRQILERLEFQEASSFSQPNIRLTW